MSAEPFRLAGGTVSIFRIPLKTPFITAAGRKNAVENVGVTVRLTGGAEGYGEAAGSVVRADLRPARLAAALRSELRRLAGVDARAWATHADRIRHDLSDLPPAAAALECALADAAAREQGVSLKEWFGGAGNRIETDLTISADLPEAARTSARRAAEEGFRVLKVKVGAESGRDWPRVETVWEVLKKGLKKPALLLDGNQGMTPSSALRLIEKCLKRGVRVGLLEQPLPRGRLRETARLKRLCPVPLAADEDARSADDVLRLLDMDAADVINVKIAKSGLSESFRIIALARAARKRLMIGCMLESARGLEASAALALGTGAFEFADIDSDHLLSMAQPRGDLRRDGPWISLCRECRSSEARTVNGRIRGRRDRSPATCTSA